MNRYSKQTVVGIFFAIQNKIVKSPAMQPKLQTNSIETIKSVFEALEQAKYNVAAATAPDSFASDLSEKELQTRQKKAWEAYMQEYRQMLIDLGQKVPPQFQQQGATTTTTSDKKPAAAKKPAANKPKPAATKPKAAPTTTKPKPATATTTANKPKVAAKKAPQVNKDGTLRSKL